MSRPARHALPVDKVAPRIRRTAEDARRAILEATEARLVAHGPDAIRLQEVAADVGVAHTTILHHFGSRERLVEEVVARRIEAMNADVIALAAAGRPDPAAIAELVRRLFDAFGPGGHARVVAFLALSGAKNPSLDGVGPVTRAVHALRSATLGAANEGDSRFLVLLTTFALFGEAIAGPLFRGEDPERPDPAAREQFLAGLTRFVQSQVRSGPRGDDATVAPRRRQRKPKT